MKQYPRLLHAVVFTPPPPYSERAFGGVVKTIVSLLDFISSPSSCTHSLGYLWAYLCEDFDTEPCSWYISGVIPVCVCFPAILGHSGW